MISASFRHPRSTAAARAPAVLSLVLLSGASAPLGCSEATDALDGGGSADFASIYESEEFQACAGCHAPDAPGRTEGIEATQDWSTLDSARRSLRDNASGMIGNFAGCNGVPLLGSSAEQSLLVASLDFDVRASFELASFPDCTGDAIADQTLRLGGPLPAGLLQDLKDWIDDGAP